MDTVSRGFFFQKEFFISGFFPGGDVVAGNLFLEYTHICTLKILSHCTTTCNIEHVVSHVLLTCIFDCLLHDSTGIAKLCCFLIYSQFS